MRNSKILFPPHAQLTSSKVQFVEGVLRVGNMFGDGVQRQAENEEGTIYKDENVPKDRNYTTILPKDRSEVDLCAVGCALDGLTLKDKSTTKKGGEEGINYRHNWSGWGLPC
jgi:hypothetical protein